MDPNTPEDWATILWKYFYDEVASGDPVYLTIDSRLICKLFHESFPHQPNIKNIKIEDYFNVACSKLLSVDNNRATVKAFTYELIDNGFSCAIVLAAQQILVVEEMAKTSNFTHDAYFPRYRERIKFTKKNINNHQNPFNVKEFEKIWMALKKDLLSIPGCSEYSITFKEGRGSKNLTRNYPISQALFAQKDLFKLRSLVPTEKFHCDTFRSSSSLQKFFDHHKWEITKRSRDKIYISGMRRQLYVQFRNYLDIPEESFPKTNTDIEEPINTSKQGVFVIEKKSKGIRESFYLRFQINFKTVYYDNEAKNYLDKFTDQGDIFLLTKTEDFRGYSNSEAFREIIEGDTLILFYKNENEGQSKLRLNKLFHENWEGDFERVFLTNFSDYSFFICKGLPKEVGSLFVKFGKLTDEPNSPKKRLECLGGIQLDKTQNLYLKGYPPIDFKVDSYSLMQDEIVVINDINIKVKNLMSRLLQVEDYDSFLIQYKDFQVVLKIKSLNQDAFNPIGFEFINNEVLSPISRVHNPEVPALRGWVFPSEETSIDREEQDFKLEIFEVAWLIQGFDEKWVSTTAEAVQLVIEYLPQKIPNSMNDIIKKRLLMRRALPISLITRHKNIELAHIS
ncbi:hypothetical protein N9L33_04335 [Nitrospinae bacterium]|nr:hypothetical protein [Nitrospinota bacterium]